MPDIDGWHWEWVGPSHPDPKPRRGRRFYDAVRATRSRDGLDRTYYLGDTVSVSSEGAEKWIAQVVEFFEAKPNDDDLSEILKNDARKASATHSYDLMRCTLRWFFNQNDPSVPSELQQRKDFRPFNDEVYFSDFVEGDGFNDVTVIEGLAFLRQTPTSAKQFQRQPNDPRYIPDRDHVRIVRAFFDSKSDAGELRQLDRGELAYLLSNPTKDKTLYDTARQRMIGRAGLKDPVMKGTGAKKRKRVSISNHVVLDEDDVEDEIRPVDKKRRRRKPGVVNDDGQSDHSQRKPKHRRRKYVIKDEDDDGTDSGSHNDDGTENQAALPDRTTVQRQSLDKANTEVLDLVKELNGSMGLDPLDDEEILVAGNYNLDDEPLKPHAAAPLARHHSFPYRTALTKPKEGAPPAKPIVIELNSSDDEDSKMAKLTDTASPAKKNDARHQSKAQLPKKQRQPFQPTAHNRNTSMEAIVAAGKLQERSGESKSPQYPTVDYSVKQSRQMEALEGATRAVDGTAAGQNPILGKTVVDHRVAESGENEVSSVGKMSLPVYSVGGPSPTNRQSQKEVEARESTDKAVEHHVISEREKDGSEFATQMKQRGKKTPNTLQHKSGAMVFLNAAVKPSTEDTTDGSIRKNNTETSDSFLRKEVQEVLKSLTTEFNSISQASQNLLSSHIDVIFNSAVSKISECKLSGKIGTDDSRLVAIAEEIRGNVVMRNSTNDDSRPPADTDVRIVSAADSASP